MEKKKEDFWLEKQILIIGMKHIEVHAVIVANSYT